MKYSIIVPVYNVQDYLRECLDSIVFQTFTDFELIIINDGSTDNSLAICEEYSKKHQNIVLISQENKGQGSARNTGIQHAKGEWLIFIDSDDYVDRDLLRKVDNMINEKSLQNNQMVMYNMDLLYDDGAVTANDSIKGIETLKDFEAEKFFRITPSFCEKVIHRSIFIDNNIRFPEKRYYEDFAILAMLVSNIEKIYVIDEPLYTYRQRATSTMHSSDIKKMYDIVYDVDDQYKYLEKINASNKTWQAFEYCSVINVLLFIGYEMIYIDPSSEYIQKAVDYMTERFPNLYDNIYLPLLNKRNRINLKLIRKGKYKKIYRYARLKRFIKNILVKLHLRKIVDTYKNTARNT